MNKLTPTENLFQAPPVGSRICAVLSADDDVVRILGFGVRIEDEVPEPVNMLADAMHTAVQTNPTLLLDNGTKVYGLECWWGPENSVVKWIGKRRVLQVKPRRD